MTEKKKHVNAYVNHFHLQHLAGVTRVRRKDHKRIKLAREFPTQENKDHYEEDTKN